MANIAKRNSGRMPVPFSGIVDSVFRNDLTRFFDDDFWGFNGLTSNYQIPVNIRETDKTYELEVVAPGLRKEDFNISINNNMLNVSFEHKQENKEEDNNEGWLRHEYRTQSFSRSFTLDETVDADRISASYKDGILMLTVPKKEGAQRITKTIQVK